MENLLGVLNCKVYVTNKQFLSINELKVAIVKEWYKISQSVLNHLVISMKNTVLEVIRINRESISY